MKKRFSMRNKLLIIFGVLIAVAAIVEGLLAVRTARQAVVEKIEIHLKDKATDTAEIIDGRVNAFFQFLEGIARMPILRNTQAAFVEKMKILEKEAKFNPAIHALYITDTKGNMYFLDGTSADTADYPYFKTSITGKRFFSEPYMDPSINKFIMDISVPVYGDGNNIIGVLIAAIDGLWLSNQISRIAEIFVVNYRMNFYQYFHNDKYYFGELNVLSIADEYKSDSEKLVNTFVYDDGTVRGFIRIKEKEIKKLFVESQFQNMGIGSKLLNFAIGKFDVKFLWVLEYNTKGINFYKKYGFFLTSEKVLEDEYVPLVKLVRI